MGDIVLQHKGRRKLQATSGAKCCCVTTMKIWVVGNADINTITTCASQHNQVHILFTQSTLHGVCGVIFYHGWPYGSLTLTLMFDFI